MGAPDDDPGAIIWEKPQHQVRLSDFYMCKYTVTLGQFEEFIAETGYQTDADKDGGHSFWNGKNWEKKTEDNWRCDVKGDIQKDLYHPVIRVTWNDAVAFCNFLNAKYGFPSAYDSKGGSLDSSGKTTTLLTRVHGFRLPSEAEWEYAARGGQFSRGYTYAGGNNVDEVAWYSANSEGHTHPVGLKKPNELYLYDMSGSVGEWCQDKWHPNYEGAPADGSAKEGSNGSFRIFRGGGWNGIAVNCRVAFRSFVSADCRGHYIGFRIVFDPQFGG